MIIFIISISSCLILVLCFFLSWFALLKLGCLLYTCVCYMPSNLVNRNTWYHIIVCKLFILDRNTWYHITACKKKLLKNNYTKNVNININIQCTWFSDIQVWNNPRQVDLLLRSINQSLLCVWRLIGSGVWGGGETNCDNLFTETRQSCRFSFFSHHKS